MSVKQWNQSSRPREKLLHQGISSLSDAELLALILRSGNENQDCVQLAQSMLIQCGNISGILGLTLQELMVFKGVGLAKASELIACIEIVKRINYEQIKEKKKITCAKDIVDWLKVFIGNEKQEYFVAIFLDYKNRIIDYKTICVGTSNEVTYSIKDLFSFALRKNSERIIVAHNHPSQIITPSLMDDSASYDIVQAGKIVGIEVIDHIIVCNDDYYSYAEKHLI